MADQAHKETDKELEKMERKLRVVYGQAAARSQQKLGQFLDKFQELDAIKRRQVQEGKLDRNAYITWRKNKVAMSENYRAMMDTLTSDMVNTNRIAASVINGHLSEVYANNYNFGTYQIEHDSRINTSFTLYDRQTVERLMRDNPDIIPIKARVDIPKDKLWNKRKINDVVTQSILAGDSIPDIAKSLTKVAEMNKAASVRTARTATTSAQNGGRIDSYKRAKEMGIDIQQQWVATLDNRTRDTHRALDGEIIDVAKDKWHPAKFSNGCKFPGDPAGPPEEIYNCRCTLIGVIDKIDYKLSDVTQRDSKLGEMSYDEWKAGHQPGRSIGTSTTEVPQPTVNMFNFRYGENNISGHSVNITRREKYEFPDGTSTGVYKTASADIYTLDDGTKFIFPSDMDTEKQTAHPSNFIEYWYRLPESYRKMIQKTIVVVDYRNPKDAYWEEKYKIKNFVSYATGGETITFYAHSGTHWRDKVVSTYAHEGGHYIDKHQTRYDLAEGVRVSESQRWADAAQKDLELHSFDDEYKGVSDYAKRTLKANPGYFVEDFADSCDGFTTNHDFFVANFPNRAKILEAILNEDR